MVVALHRRRLQSFTYVLANLAVIGAKRVGLYCRVSTSDRKAVNLSVQFVDKCATAGRPDFKGRGQDHDVTHF